jgi:EXLDI family protein
MYKYMYMPTKTIYVSEQDAPVFEEAREVAGETLSSIIVRALREFLARERQKQSDLKEISVRTGSRGSENQQRFYGTLVGSWRGFNDNHDWWMQANIYRTQKGNWAVHLTEVCRATLLTDKKRWRDSGDYMLETGRSQLLVAQDPEGLEDKVPTELFRLMKDLAAHSDQPITFLDI